MRQEGTLNLLVKLSGGNMGAATVLMELNEKFGPAPILDLRQAGITGGEIWALFKDECNENIETMAKILADGTAKEKLTKNRSSRFYKPEG